jgi:membrane protein YqaA with SNARE-associated domain
MAACVFGCDSAGPLCGALDICAAARISGKMLRRLYNWTLALSASPRAPAALGAVSFAESSFFPIPPDVLLLPMALARPDKAYQYAAICTVTSVLGGLFGYAIGALLYDTLGAWLVGLYGYGQKIDAFRALYQEWGHWIILIKGLTPIPYKIVTIASGIAQYNLFWFVVLSIITRGLRFFLIAALIHRYGVEIRGFIENRLGLLLGLVALGVVGGFVLVKYLL